MFGEVYGAWPAGYPAGACAGSNKAIDLLLNDRYVHLSKH